MPTLEFGRRVMYQSPTRPETATSTAEKASEQLLKLVGKVIDTDIGPLTESIKWAENRLARVQGPRYEPNSEPTRTVRPDKGDDIEKVIKGLIVESVEAESQAVSQGTRRSRSQPSRTLSPTRGNI